MIERPEERPEGDAETGYGAARDGDLDEAPEQVQAQARKHASKDDDKPDYTRIEGEALERG